MNIQPTLPLNQVLLGDAIEVLKSLPDNSVDAVITDPPYAEVNRDYGRWTEQEWLSLMRDIVFECRRVLKPKGSAVFILQPNSSKLGSMRLWLWRFMLETGESWNIVQDAYWWNYTAMPLVHSHKKVGLLKGSVKPCVWVGDPDCYRDQESVLCEPADLKATKRRAERLEGTRRIRPSGASMDETRCAQLVLDRGGVAPFNLLPFSNANSVSSSGSHGHGAGTPIELAKWWIRYLCPENGVILDPFMGAGTMALAAIEQNRDFIGVEKDPGYHAIALSRIARSLEVAA